MESINSLGLASLLSKTPVSVEQDTESSAGQGQWPHVYTYGDEGEGRERKKATYQRGSAWPWTCWTTNSTRRCLHEQLQCPMYTLQRFRLHPHHPAPRSRLFHAVESKFGRGRPEDGGLWRHDCFGWGWGGWGRLDAGGDAGVVLGSRFAGVVDVGQPLPASRSPLSLGVCLRTGVCSVQCV
jgi:hypothetical protein